MSLRRVVGTVCLVVVLAATSLSLRAPAAESPKPKDGPLGMKFVFLPKGSFYMGYDGEKKGVKTEIKEAFEIAVTPVTHGQWDALMPSNPSLHARNGYQKERVKDVSDEDLKSFPVENLFYQEVQKFIKKVNEKESGHGYLYRLPTEAEWEYACRGGATSEEECSFRFYLDKPTNDLSSKQANFNGNYPEGKGEKGPFLDRPTKVGSYPPNKLGLYDMHGNVWQFCSDLYTPKSPMHAVRGGGYESWGSALNAAYRVRGAPLVRYHLGFRLVRVAEEKK